MGFAEKRNAQGRDSFSGFLNKTKKKVVPEIIDFL